MSKQKRTDKNEQVLDREVVSEINQKVKPFKSQWSLFVKNKEWILSLLFVSSIINSVLLYGLFGINILEFYTLTDIFVNFAKVLIPFVLLIPLWFLIDLLPYGRTKYKIHLVFIGKIAVFCFFAVIVSQIYNNYFGALFILFIVLLFKLLEKEKHFVYAWFAVLFMLFVAIVQPLENRLMYMKNTQLIDRLSFEYMEKKYDLSNIDQYYYIGGSVNYFFVYDKSTETVEVIPKSECRNITRKPLFWKDLWKSDNFINTYQKERKRRFRKDERPDK